MAADVHVCEPPKQLHLLRVDATRPEPDAVLHLKEAPESPGSRTKPLE
jgi:hypothetical protein